MTNIKERTEINIVLSSVNNISSFDEIILSPNPTKGKLNIDLNFSTTELVDISFKTTTSLKSNPHQTPGGS